MKNGPNENGQNQSNSIHFVYERLAPARLTLHNDEPLQSKGIQGMVTGNTKYLLCNFVDSEWSPVTQKVALPTYQKSKHLYQGKLVMSTNKRWDIVTFEENDVQQKEKERPMPTLNR